MPDDRAVFHPAAAAEFEAAIDFYSTASRRAAVDFVARIESAIELIAEAPPEVALRAGLVRRYVLRQFPFANIYRRHNSGIQVIAAVHLHRRPGYWTARLR